ncbi:MAG TPA: thermonuclease family protein [Nitrospiraceae bacterium]|nr:thermonuclease family protein [Nitrospiraceae bacterium]
MKKRMRNGIWAGFVLLLCGLLVGVPHPALATKSTSKKYEAKSGSRMTAAVPKDPRTTFSRLSTRSIHGVHTLRQSDSQPSIRRSRARNNARALRAQGEQVLDPARIHLLDGDTFVYGSEHIRIQGFNAVERADVGGLEATQRLDQLLHQGHVTMIRKTTDIYGRTVAEVFVDYHNVTDLLKNDLGTTR